jgi:hypothetical protein
MTEETDETKDVSVEIETEPSETGEATVEVREVAPATEEPQRIDETAAVEELKRQLAAEKAARFRAEQKAAQRQNEVDSSNLQLIRSAISTLESNAEIYVARYAEAMSAGDYQTAAAIQKEMSGAEAKLLQLRNGEEAMRSKPPQEIRSTQDPVEELASRLSPRSASWVRAHPEYAQDSRNFQRMVAAHNLATAEGIVPDTDEYFDAIETTLKIKKLAPPVSIVAAENPMEQAARPRAAQQPAPAAAPVTRGTPGSRTMRLTSEEMDIARLNKMTPEEYAKQKLKIQRGSR